MDMTKVTRMPLSTYEKVDKPALVEKKLLEIAEILNIPLKTEVEKKMFLSRHLEGFKHYLNQKKNR